MKISRLPVIAALAMLVCAQVSGQTDIEQCIDLAYDNYPQIREYDLIDISRKYDLKNAALAWAPQLSVSGKASWQSAVVEMPFDIPDFKFNIPHDQYGITADVTQQIWDGGATGAKRRLIDAGADVKNRQLEVNLYSIRSRVQNIYLGIILIDKQMELNKVLRDNLLRNMDEVKAMVEGGVAYESDIDQIKVSILSCDQQQVSLETDRRAYVKMLSLLTGQDMSGMTFTEPSVDEGGSAFAGVFRPELALYDAQAKQVQLQKDQLKTSISPKLNLNLQAGYGRPGLNMLSGKFDPYFVAGLKLQWNFGALYTLRNDRSKSDAEASRVDLARKSFLLNTSVEAAQKQGEIEKAADVVGRDREIIEIRQSIRETAEHQYKEGVIKMNDYLSLLDEEFKARLNYHIHNIQYIMAVYDLRNTLGTDNK
ncbi:MAG: TolC family protein [Bacteroidales bacterium]|nr:TolC family protein [Bacteroidales bacterium]